MGGLGPGGLGLNNPFHKGILFFGGEHRVFGFHYHSHNMIGSVGWMFMYIPGDDVFIA